MKNTLETRIGMFVAFSVLAAVLILETIGVENFRPGYRLYADFNTVQDLKEGDRVKMAGVEIGRIKGVTLNETNNKVRVTLRLDAGVRVRTSSIATVKFTGLLGQNFVELSFGTGGTWAEPNSVLETKEQPDLSAIMQKVDNVATGVENLTKSFTGEKIDNLLGPFTDFLKANKEPLTATIANVHAISSQISSQISQGKGTVGKLIKDDTLYNQAVAAVTNLQDTANGIRDAVADARKIIDQANAGQGTVGKLIKDETLYRETTASMTNLKEILQKVNQGQGSIGKLVNDQEFYRNAKLTLQKLDKATEGLEDQGPLSVLGILVNNLL